MDQVRPDKKMIIELSGSSGDFLGHRLVVKGNGRTERGGRGKGVQSSSTEYKGGLKPMTNINFNGDRLFLCEKSKKSKNIAQFRVNRMFHLYFNHYKNASIDRLNIALDVIT